MVRIRSASLALACLYSVSVAAAATDADGAMPAVGHINYESPHAGPIALLPDESLVYAVNTPADTVDVIDPDAR